MQVLVQPITPTEEEKKVPYWNIMFDDVQPCRDATPEKETEGDYKFISKRQFEEFLVMMDVRLRTVVEELEAERRGRIELVVEVKNLRSNTADLTTPSLQPDTSIGEAKSSPGKGIIEVIGLGVNCLAFDVDLSEIIKAKNTNDVAQSLMHRLEFRVNNTEVSEHNSNTAEVVDMNEATCPYDFEPFFAKRMRRKLKGMQLVHFFTHLQSYKRRKVGDILANEDFVVALDPMQIILKPNVEVFVDVLTCWAGSPR
ncbi:hypothetical protein DVH24_035894 [Malus domestica]|uniref:Uncharacterized protein n=1 Tax=Malus domestica TaxID=3750 RepID=A0A498JQA5_MALDO|nr:hypothetical protein DVH24_035894 [Malus domestica]